MFCSGVKLANATDAMPWYAPKLEVAQYLEQINKDKKVCWLPDTMREQSIKG